MNNCISCHFSWEETSKLQQTYDDNTSRVVVIINFTLGVHGEGEPLVFAFKGRKIELT